jgi:sarcosine oxidase subunit gamma
MHDRAQFWSPVPDWSRVSLHTAGIDVAPVNAASIWLVSGDARQLLARCGAREALGPRQICGDDSYALHIAPDRVLFVANTQALDASTAGAPGCAITDISDGIVIFEIGGEAAADLMAQGSEYPFDDTAVLPGESAMMQFAGFSLAVSRRVRGWRLHIERPWAAALWRWLQAHVEQGAA